MPDPRSCGPWPDAPAISRRQALVGAFGAVAAGGAIATAGPASAARLARAASPPARPHPVYRRSRFAAQVGRVVPVADPPGARMRLEGIGDVSDGRGGIADGHEYAFSLRFRQVNGPALPQGIHTLEVPGAGPVRLFLAPVGRPDRRRYEAVIHRLITG